MRRVDIMVDLETLGTTTDSTVFQISAAKFDITTGIVSDTFNMCCDIEKGPVSADGSTLKWWLKTDKELLSRLLNEGTCSEAEMFAQFHEWLGDCSHKTYFWGNGISFDNVFVRDKFTHFGLTYPIHFRNERDVRTILELAAMKAGMSESKFKKERVPENPEKHNALSDVLYQVQLVYQCHQEIMSAKEK